MTPKSKKVIFLTPAILIAVVLTAFLFLCEQIRIPTTGMAPTFDPGDLALFTPLFGQPKADQIVCFDVDKVPVLYQIFGRKERFISRVVALPGDRITKEVDHYKINGEPISKVLNVSGLPDSGVTYPLSIPDGHVYTLSDNYSNSMDSRVYGLVPINAIRSSYLLTYWHAKANKAQ